MSHEPNESLFQDCVDEVYQLGVMEFLNKCDELSIKVPAEFEQTCDEVAAKLYHDRH